jgi:cytoskeletal protein RodZ
MDNEKPLLKDLLRERLESEGLTLEQLKQQTGITERYLVAFFNGHPDRLPPPPYVRGYLFKITLQLNLDGEEIWKTYRHELDSRRSGDRDRLPINRFAIKRPSKMLVIGGVLAMLVILYAAANVNRFLGKPMLSVTSPATETLVTTASTITLTGSVDPNDSLFIDDNAAFVNRDGTFRHTYALEPGLNQIKLTAKRLLGRETTVIRQIIYQP